jgi:hypothetical protein
VRCDSSEGGSVLITIIRDNTCMRLHVNNKCSYQQHRLLHNRWLPIESVQSCRLSLGGIVSDVYCDQRVRYTHNSTVSIEKFLGYCIVPNGHILVCGAILRLLRNDQQ